MTADRKKEISEQYKAESDKFGEELSKNGRRLYDESFNRAVAEMDQFDKQQQRKYGDDYAERPGYLEDGGQYFAKFFATDYNKTIKEFYLTNEHYINAMDLLDKYGMETWDDLARDDLEAISYVFDS